jgi:hypothetical protein
MRALAYAAILGVGLMALSAATADAWTDPAGRFTVNLPAGWVVSPTPHSTSHTWLEAGDAYHQCDFIGEPNSVTAGKEPALVRRTAADNTQFTSATWTALANSSRGVFPAGGVTFTSNTQDNAGFWPIQRAELAVAHGMGSPPQDVGPIHAAFQSRPGIDLIAFCYMFIDSDHPDNPAFFDPIIRSMGTANDATLQAAAEAYETAHAQAAQQAQQQAQQQQQQQQQQQDSQQHHRHDDREGAALSHP